MRALALILTLGSLAACGGERISPEQQYSDGSLQETSDPGENAVVAEVRTLPWKHVEWEYKFNNRPISRLTMGGDQLFIETPDNTVVAMNRFTGQTSWMFRIDTDTPLDWPPVVAQGVPEEIRELEASLRLVNRQIDDTLKEKGVGKETQALQKKRNEYRERLRVAAFGDNVYFISHQIIYCLDRISGGLRWTHRLNFVPSAKPFAIRNFVFVPGADSARVWVLNVENKGAEMTSFRASILSKENQIMNSPVYSDPSLYFVCHDGNVYCYKVTDGTLTWTYPTERSLRADPTVYVYRSDEAPSQEGPKPAAPGAAPAMEAPKPGDGMAPPAMEKKDAPAMGAPAMGAPAMGAPAAKDDKGGKKKAQVTTRILFVGSTDNAFYALDADGGNLIWKYETGSVIKAPAVAKDSTVYVATDEGALHAFEVMPMHRDPKTNASLGNKRNGNLRWKLPLAERFIFKGKERVYVMGPKKEIWAVDEMSGATLGRYQTNLLQYVLTNTADEFIYVANSSGHVFCLKESRQTY
ncbi:MAG: PQQ-binding-like beta-propeller repeat protein [Planctomycetaceae bacterium]|nr:PQQ-binding-like beta-propeller repeat protein [Planctomycetaceae bacterium]